MEIAQKFNISNMEEISKVPIEYPLIWNPCNSPTPSRTPSPAQATAHAPPRAHNFSSPSEKDQRNCADPFQKGTKIVRARRGVCGSLRGRECARAWAI